MTSDLETEKAIVQQTADAVQVLGDQLADASQERTKDLQREFDRKMDIYGRQVKAFQDQFPGTVDGRIFEASLYGYQAIAKFYSVGFLRTAAKAVASGTRKATVESSGGGGLLGVSLKLSAAIIGGTVAAGTSLAAKQQEKANAREALDLLDKAIGVFDAAGSHLIKAHILIDLGQNNDAVRELDYIICRFQNDDAYVPARQLKDEILAPRKKKWFGF